MIRIFYYIEKIVLAIKNFFFPPKNKSNKYIY
jgi:hypothetical protein